MDKTAERVHNQTIDFVNKAYEELSTIAYRRKDLRYFNKDYNDVSIDENISNMIDSAQKRSRITKERSSDGDILAVGTAGAAILEGAGEGVGSVFESIGEGISEASKGLGEGVATAAEGVGDGTSTAAKGIGEGLATAAEGVGEGAAIAAEGVGDAVSTAAQGVGKMFEGLTIPLIVLGLVLLVAAYLKITGKI